MVKWQSLRFCDALFSLFFLHCGKEAKHRDDSEEIRESVFCRFASSTDSACQFVFHRFNTRFCCISFSFCIPFHFSHVHPFLDFSSIFFFNFLSFIRTLFYKIGNEIEIKIIFFADNYLKRNERKTNLFYYL